VVFSSVSRLDSDEDSENPEPALPTRHGALEARVFAIATFDSNGLLERSEFRSDRTAPHWTEAIFAAIGFKGLLDATLNHPTFRYAKVTSANHVVFLVRRRRRYVALLSEPALSWAEEVEIRDSLKEVGTGDLLALLRSSEGRLASPSAEGAPVAV
jgi:hypothetical protein